VAVEAAAGACAIAFSAILFRLAHVSPSTGAFFRCLYATPALALVARAERGRLPASPVARRARVLAAAAGAWLGIDLIIWNHAIDAIGAGLSTVLGNTQIVLVPLAAWGLWGERPGRRMAVAAAFVLAGVVLISGVLGSSAYGAHPGAGVVYGVLTGVAYAGFLLCLRASGQGRSPAAALTEATASSAAVCFVAGLVVGDLDLTPGWHATAWLVLLALTSQVLGWLLITASLTRLPAALTAVTLTLQPVATVIFSAIILGESPSPWQVVGVVVILGAVLVASSARRPPAQAAA
jgi:drug/metabolite transporter (DMT)-like permease